MERLPKEIHQDAKKAHEEGDLERAMALYAESTYFHDAAKVALQLEQPSQARDFYLDAGDTWSAEQVGKKHNIDAPSYKSPVYVENGTIPRYSGSNDLVSIVSQGEQGITNSSDKKPVLATFGIGPCVSVVGYDSSKKTGFLTHYDSCVDLENSLASLFGLFPKDQEFNFDVSIIGGDGSSVSTYRAIKSQLESKSDTALRLNVSEEDIFGNESRSVALDTRTGQKFVYDPKQFDDVRINVPVIDGQTYAAKMAYNSFHQE
jgi:hypothetical protein